MTLIRDDSILVPESEKLPHLAGRMLGGKQICISEVVHIHRENVQAYYKTTYDTWHHHEGQLSCHMLKVIIAQARLIDWEFPPRFSHRCVRDNRLIGEIDLIALP